MKLEEKVIDLLEKQKLKKTQTRIDILSLFLSQPYALAHHDLEQALGSGYDRVTLYRTLNTFEEKGLIHKVLDDSGIAKFAVCADHCSEDHHHDDHIHFSCTVCENTYCLDDTPIPALKLPAGFRVQSLHVYVKGVCATCAEKGN